MTVHRRDGKEVGYTECGYCLMFFFTSIYSLIFGNQTNITDLKCNQAMFSLSSLIKQGCRVVRAVAPRERSLSLSLLDCELQTCITDK